MTIAFDLDNTLIRCDHDFALETPVRCLWASLVGSEHLRAGIVDLHRFCRSQGWNIWVYTTSYRSPWAIRKLFWLHGLHLDGVVNQARHTRDVRVRSTKYPPQYGIDLLVDDSHGVRIEGERHGFRTVVVDPTDSEWAEKVKAQILLLAKGVA